MKCVLMAALFAAAAFAESPEELLEPWVGVEVLATRSLGNGFRPVLGIESGGVVYFSNQGDELCRGRGLFKHAAGSEDLTVAAPMALKARDGQVVKELPLDLCLQTLFSDQGKVFVRYLQEGRTTFGLLSGDTVTPFGPHAPICASAAWCWKRDLGIEFRKGNLDSFEWFYAHEGTDRVDGVAKASPGGSLDAFSLELNFLPSLFATHASPASLSDIVRASGGFYLIHEGAGSNQPDHITFRGPHLVSVNENPPQWGVEKLGNEILAWKAVGSGIVFASQGRPGTGPEEVSVGYLTAEKSGDVQWSETLMPHALQGLTGLDLVHGGLLITRSDLGAVVWLGRSEPYKGTELLPPSLEDLSKSEYLQLKEKLKTRNAKTPLP